MPNNNPLTEVGAIVLAAVLIIIAGLLLYVGKIDTAFATSMFILAGALFAGNLALKAPSPTQQAALLQLTAQALASQAQPAQLVQAPASPQGGSVIAPAVNPTAPAVPLFNPIVSNIASENNPFMLDSKLLGEKPMPQAIQTTMTDIPADEPLSIQ